MEFTSFKIKNTNQVVAYSGISTMGLFMVTAG